MVVDQCLADELERYAFWLRYPSRGRRALGDGTIRCYLYTIRRFFLSLDGQEVDQDAAEAFVRALETSGNGPRSIGRHIYALRSYFAFHGLKLEMGAPAFQKRLPRWLTGEEWASLLAAAEAPLTDTSLPHRVHTRARFHRAALMVYGGAGLRLSEGCALRREDIDAAGYIKVLGKGGVENVVPVEDPVVGAIQEWLGTHASLWAFPGRKGGHLHPRTMQAAIRQLMVVAGVKDIRRAVHSLRHTVGADLRQRGADIRDIQDVLRHASISSTQLYTHLAREDLRQKLPRRFPAPGPGRFSQDAK